MKKRVVYERFRIERICINVQRSILAGSVTDHKVMIQDSGVTVQPFEKDDSFGDHGTFDLTF